MDEASDTKPAFHQSQEPVDPRLSLFGADAAAAVAAMRGSADAGTNPGLVADLCNIILRQSSEIASLVKARPPHTSSGDDAPPEVFDALSLKSELINATTKVCFQEVPILMPAAPPARMLQCLVRPLPALPHCRTPLEHNPERPACSIFLAEDDRGRGWRLGELRCREQAPAYRQHRPPFCGARRECHRYKAPFSPLCVWACRSLSGCGYCN